MNREIKFRAWVNGGMEIYTLRPFAGVTETSLFIGVCSDESIPIMQYTGLKDKSGKEIYEGDIVKCGELSALLLIEFRDGAFGYEYYRKFHKHEKSSGLDVGMQDFVSEWEIIGNIFQNPELTEASHGKD